MLPLDDRFNLSLLRFIGTPSSSNPFGNAGGHESTGLGSNGSRKNAFTKTGR